MAGAPRIFIVLMASKASSGVDTLSHVTVWLISQHTVLDYSGVEPLLIFGAPEVNG